MDGVELHSVRVYLGEQRMDVMVLDAGVKRVVGYRWQTQGATPVPLDTWWSAVCGEIEWQRTQEAKAAAGTLIPSF